MPYTRPNDLDLYNAFCAKYEVDDNDVVYWRGTAKLAGFRDGKGYRSICILGHRFKLHRIIWLLHTMTYPEGLMDHINGNPMDNRFANLRMATHAQNVRNRIRSGQFATGVQKGERGRYLARIQNESGQKVYLGTYDTEAEAAAAYAGASVVLHGEFSAKLSREATRCNPDGIL